MGTEEYRTTALGILLAPFFWPEIVIGFQPGSEHSNRARQTDCDVVGQTRPSPSVTASVSAADILCHRTTPHCRDLDDKIMGTEEYRTTALGILLAPFFWPEIVVGFQPGPEHSNLAGEENGTEVILHNYLRPIFFPNPSQKVLRMRQFECIPSRVKAMAQPNGSGLSNDSLKGVRNRLWRIDRFGS